MWLAYHQMVEIELFRVLVVRFVLSLMVLEILFDSTIFDISVRPCKINDIVKSPFS